MSPAPDTSACLTAVVHTARVASSPAIPTRTQGCLSLLAILLGEQQHVHVRRY